LKQLLDFPVKQDIETMAGLAVIKGLKIVETPLDFPNDENIETIARLAIIQGLKYVEKTVRFFK